MLNNLKAASEALKKKQEPMPLDTSPNAMTTTYDTIKQQQRQQRPFPPATWQTSNMNKDRLRQALRAERKRLGLTQREVAKRSGMSQGTITRAESNMWISLDCLAKIAYALGKEVIIN